MRRRLQGSTRVAPPSAVARGPTAAAPAAPACPCCHTSLQPPGCPGRRWQHSAQGLRRRYCLRKGVQGCCSLAQPSAGPSAGTLGRAPRAQPACPLAAAPLQRALGETQHLREQAEPPEGPRQAAAVSGPQDAAAAPRGRPGGSGRTAPRRRAAACTGAAHWAPRPPGCQTQGWSGLAGAGGGARGVQGSWAAKPEGLA